MNISLKTVKLHMYHLVNTQRHVGWQLFSSPMDSIGYEQILSKLFIVRVLGKTLLGIGLIFLLKSRPIALRIADPRL
jgi:hypothetical protein